MATNYVQVPVPEDRVEDVMRFILSETKALGRTRRATRPVARSSLAGGFNPLTNDRYPNLAQMPEDEIREAYRGGSALQRRIWNELATHPGEPITWSELSDRLGESRHAVPGSIKQFLDRAKEQYEGRRPHHEAKDTENQTWWIWLDQRAADIVLDEAGDE